MPKRKSPHTATGYSNPYQKRNYKHARHTRSSSTHDGHDHDSTTATPDIPLTSANNIPLPAAPPTPTLHDPSTHTPAFIAAQQQVVVQKLHHARKVVVRALKAAKGLEKVRLIKKKGKAGGGKAADGGVDAGVKKVEREMEMLKELEVERVAEGVLGKLLTKQKRIMGSVFWPGEEAVGWVGRKKGGVVGSEEEKAKEGEVLGNNVIAMLCNHKPVKDALAQSLEMVKEAMGIVDEKPSKGKKGNGKEVVDGKGKKSAPVDEDEGDSDDDEEDYDSEGEEQASRPKSNSKSQATKWSHIDPSRGEDEEWSGADDDEDEDGGEFGDIPDGDEDEGSSGSDEAEDDDEEDGDGIDATLLSKLDKYIAPGSSASSSRSSSPSPSPSPSLSNSSSPPPPPPKKLKSTTKAPKSTPLTTKTPTTKSTFLPSLMSGYISGSDNDSDAPDAAYYSRLNGKGGKNSKRGPPEKQERKNRMGQQARRALAEKKFGEKARHVRLGLGAAGQKREGKERLRKAGERGMGLGGKGGRAGGVGREKMGGKPGVVGKGGKPPVVEGPLHPSWEAARKAKEAKAQVKFQGKKITFD